MESPIDVSQEIAACVYELILIEHKERDYMKALERKGELERRIELLQDYEMEARAVSP